MQLGRDEEAADALRLAVESRPGWAMGHALLAAALLLAGHNADARRHYAEFQALAGDPEAESPAWRESVPDASTARSYCVRNQRIVDALRRLSEMAGQALRPLQKLRVEPAGASERDDLPVTAPNSGRAGGSGLAIRARLLGRQFRPSSMA
jgi:hypothetical protein